MKQEERIRELEAEVQLWKENAQSNRDEYYKLIRERDEALFDMDFSRDLYKLKDVQLDELRRQLAVARKQNSEQLTILQENGLAEYGN